MADGLTWTIWRAPANASKWRMGFNSAFKGLMMYVIEKTVGLWNAILRRLVINRLSNDDPIPTLASLYAHPSVISLTTNVVTVCQDACRHIPGDYYPSLTIVRAVRLTLDLFSVAGEQDGSSPYSPQRNAALLLP